MNVENIKDIAQIVALLGAGIFFIYKMITGYLRVNLSLAIECQRQKSVVGGADDLVVSLKLQKGPTGSVTLHDAQVRVSYEGTVQALSVSTKSPLLRLVPGEETQLAVACAVPVNAVCLVEVVIVGRRIRSHPFCQWRASSVSLPRAV